MTYGTSPQRAADHPRVCGECVTRDDGPAEYVGSSPRMRGMPTTVSSSLPLARIIPAYAGNAKRDSMQLTFSSGSSPRMRGLPAGTHRRPRRTRIIPAYAGNASTSGMDSGSTADHPRVCGECNEYLTKRNVPDGSSPRMRGMRFVGPRATRGSRIIPAYAGNAPLLRRHRRMAPDHPRVCGECQSSGMPACGLAGSSPRMRGMRGECLRFRALLADHPRVCGECEDQAERSSRPERIIPAYAGNAFQPGQSGYRWSDHPRVCGECARFGVKRISIPGSSPRMRGMPQSAGNTVRGSTDHPRVCGECRFPGHVQAEYRGSSPRMRGMLNRDAASLRRRRIIPAYAGNALVMISSPMAPADHPRVCGECKLWSGSPLAMPGSSPRMRGMRC